MGDGIMDNETFSFKLEGDMYMANFAYTPSCRIGNQLLFKGVLGGNGYCTGHYCIVRTNFTGTRESWQTYVENRKKLQSIEEIFQVNNCQCNFRVPKSGLALMDKAAFPTKVVSSIQGWHRPKKDDCVLVDLYRIPRKESIRVGPLFSAISHISLKQSNNQSYLTNFSAFNYREDSICITNAETSTDLAAFERIHKCTELCKMEMPSNRSEPVVVPSKGFDNLISRHLSAPACGDYHFLNREPNPMLPPAYSEYDPLLDEEPMPILPAYSELPRPSAPPMDYAQYPFYFHGDFPFRQFSVG